MSEQAQQPQQQAAPAAQPAEAPQSQQPTVPASPQQPAPQQAPQPQFVPQEQFEQVAGRLQQYEQQVQQLQSLLLQTSQALNPQSQQQAPQVDPYEYWSQAERDPLSWEEQIRQKAVQDAVQVFTMQQQRDAEVYSASQAVLQEFPELDNPQGKQFLSQYAMYLDETLPANVSISDIFKKAATDISGYVKQVAGQVAPPAQQVPQNPARPFVEGASNMVPASSDADAYGQMLNQAKQTGDVTQLLNAKLAKLSAK